MTSTKRGFADELQRQNVVSNCLGLYSLLQSCFSCETPNVTPNHLLVPFICYSLSVFACILCLHTPVVVVSFKWTYSFTLCLYSRFTFFVEMKPSCVSERVSSKRVLQLTLDFLVFFSSRFWSACTITKIIFS